MISIKADKLPNMHSTEFQGIPVVIQWPKGSTRVGERKDGTTFKTEMKASYGYIPDTVAAGDEERLDVYIGDNPDADTVYVVEQVRKGTWDFDEYKMMLGFNSLEEAEEMYLYHLGDDADVELDDISEVPFEYLFDKVMEERHEEQGQEETELHTEIETDETKNAGHHDDEKLSVVDAFIKLYKHEVDFYEECAAQVHEILEDALQTAGIRAIVTYRAKKPRKLFDKLVKRNLKRHYQNFRQIYDDIVDLAGVRVALYLPNDRDAVGQIIEQVFAPVRAPKTFPKDRDPSSDSLGYVATHYLVQLRPETLHKDELRYADTNVEIQVASVLMHSWAEVTHDLIYKPESGSLTPAEHQIVKDLNDIVQAGEAALMRLQESVELRTNEDLRFELTAAIHELAPKVADREFAYNSLKKIGKIAAKLRGTAPQELASLQNTYLKARLALWKAHKADDVDARLMEIFNQNKLREEGDFNQVQTITAPDVTWTDQARNQLGIPLDARLTQPQIQEVLALAQKLKTETI